MPLPNPHCYWPQCDNPAPHLYYSLLLKRLVPMCQSHKAKAFSNRKKEKN